MRTREPRPFHCWKRFGWYDVIGLDLRLIIKSEFTRDHIWRWFGFMDSGRKTDVWQSDVKFCSGEHNWFARGSCLPQPPSAWPDLWPPWLWNIAGMTDSHQTLVGIHLRLWTCAVQGFSSGGGKKKFVSITNDKLHNPLWRRVIEHSQASRKKKSRNFLSEFYRHE